MRLRAQLTPLPILVLPLLLLSALQLQGLSVYLQRTAQPGQEMVLLGDIATVVAADPREAEQLQRLPLWRGSGKAGVVPASLVKQKLAAEVGGEVVIVGARTLILPQGMSGEIELEFYSRLLEAAAGLPGAILGRLEIELVSQPLLPSAGGVEVTLEPARERSGASPGAGSGGAAVGGLFQASYRLKGEGEETSAQAALSVGVEVHQYLPVAVALRDLPAGSNLRWTDLALEEQDIGARFGGYLGQGDRPEAFRTVAPIARGERVDPSRLERHYLVRAGDTVTVVFVRPGLRISVPGRAYTSGAAGDRVEVRPRDAARRFSGWVSAPGEVIVEEI